MSTEVKSNKFKAKCVGPGCKRGDVECILVKLKPKAKPKGTKELESTQTASSVKEQRRRYFVLLNKLEKQKKEGKSTDMTLKQLNKTIRDITKTSTSDDADVKKLKQKVLQINRYLYGKDYKDKDFKDEPTTVISNDLNELSKVNKKQKDIQKAILKILKEEADIDIDINKLRVEKQSIKNKKEDEKEKLGEQGLRGQAYGNALKLLTKPFDKMLNELDKEISEKDRLKDLTSKKKIDLSEEVLALNIREEDLNDNEEIINEIAGLGKNAPGEGMYSDQIEEAMSNVPNFKGVISADEILTLKPSNQMSWIMNLDDSNKPGSHWVAVMIDATNDKSIMYMDPFGDPPSARFLKDIKTLVDKIKPEHMLKLKINTVPNQRDETDTCGYQSMNFINKINKGMSFKDATGFKDIKQDNTVQGEGQSNELKNQLGYGSYL